MSASADSETGRPIDGASERSGGARAHGKTSLQLFVAGMGPRSTQAVNDLKRLCASYACTTEIIDIYKRPQAAFRAQVVAVPTLLRELPPPRRCIIGTIRNLEQVAQTLGLLPHGEPLDD